MNSFNNVTMGISRAFYLLIFALKVCNPSNGDSEKKIDKDTEGSYICSFYFVRHGQTDWGPGDILQGPQDLGLNEQGIQQAHEAGLVFKELLSNPSNVKLISSPLKRALETAKEIAKVTDVVISAQEDGLRERYYGDYRLVSNNSEIPPDAETTEGFRTRVLHSLFKILLEHAHTTPLQNNQLKPLIIVSHQKVFEFLAYFLAKRSERLSQGGIGYFMLRKDGTWEIDIIKTKSTDS